MQQAQVKVRRPGREPRRHTGGGSTATRGGLYAQVEEALAAGQPIPPDMMKRLRKKCYGGQMPAERIAKFAELGLKLEKH